MILAAVELSLGLCLTIGLDVDQARQAVRSRRCRTTQTLSRSTDLDMERPIAIFSDGLKADVLDMAQQRQHIGNLHRQPRILKEGQGIVFVSWEFLNDNPSISAPFPTMRFPPQR